jgi:hypothetical protein
MLECKSGVYHDEGKEVARWGKEKLCFINKEKGKKAMLIIYRWLPSQEITSKAFSFHLSHISSKTRCPLCHCPLSMTPGVSTIHITCEQKQHTTVTGFNAEVTPPQRGSMEDSAGIPIRIPVWSLKAPSSQLACCVGGRPPRLQLGRRRRRRITSIQPRGHDEMQTDKPTFCENLVGIILCYNTYNNTDNYHN